MSKGGKSGGGDSGGGGGGSGKSKPGCPSTVYLSIGLLPCSPGIGSGYTSDGVRDVSDADGDSGTIGKDVPEGALGKAVGIVGNLFDGTAVFLLLAFPLLPILA